ncbi:hypothetical protein Ga0061061_11196 [Chelatococcus sambhunathii]|uniref:Uncharacterized protein n=1 Tax=Chelatococcus sambhunathii TaxID=363953 RepID=A0ABM9U8J9_9HYPH|nr:MULTISPECIES: hypothetical protein [Chelatococcus]CUA90172.1 hypothetical protein Ga0061061_11196 [Chelatococcus sambhunathii]
MSARPIRRIEELLPLLSRGNFLDKCNEHLAKSIETLEALPQEKGTATITVTLTFTYESGRLDVKPAVKSKLPEEKAFSGTPFWTYEGALSVQHPSQIDMFAGPRDVGMGARAEG